MNLQKEKFSVDSPICVTRSVTLKPADRENVVILYTWMSSLDLEDLSQQMEKEKDVCLNNTGQSELFNLKVMVRALISYEFYFFLLLSSAEIYLSATNFSQARDHH